MSALPLVLPDYSPAFLRAIDFVLPHETEFVRGHWGDYSDESFVRTENVAGDNGGMTRYGIDAASHPGVIVDKLTRAGAIEIYWHEWLDHRLDLLPMTLAIASFDVWVNGGHAVAWLQVALNEVMRLNPPLVEDGQIGPKTYGAARSCDVDAVLKYFLRERDGRFELLASRYANDQQFLAGWEQRDKDLAQFLA